MICVGGCMSSRAAISLPPPPLSLALSLSLPPSLSLSPLSPTCGALLFDRTSTPYLYSWRVEYLGGEFIKVLEAGRVMVLCNNRAHLCRSTAKWEVAKQVQQVCQHLRTYARKTGTVIISRIM